MYGLHPNAEIGFLTVTSDRLFRTVLEMQPKESDAGGSAGVSREEKASKVFTLHNDNLEARRGLGREDRYGPTHNGQKNTTCNNN